MKMVRCIKILNNGVLLQNIDGTIFFEEDNGVDDWLKYKNYILVNIKFNPFTKRYETICNKRTIQRYTNFHFGKSSDDKLYVKSNLLRVAYEDTQDKVWDYCVITDFNNKISKDIKANSIMFGGIKPLKNTENKNRITLRANEMTIKNICVYGNIIPDPLSRCNYEILAKDFYISHSFVDLNTVDEIYYIFKEVYGLIPVDNKFLSSGIVQRPEYFRSIIPNFNTELVSIDEVCDKVQHIIQCTTQEDLDENNKIGVLKAAFLLSMYIGTNKHYRIKELLDAQLEKANNARFNLDSTNMFLRLADLERLYRRVTI